MEGDIHCFSDEMQAIGWHPDQGGISESQKEKLAILRELWTGRKSGGMVLFHDPCELARVREASLAGEQALRELLQRDHSHGYS